MLCILSGCGRLSRNDGSARLRWYPGYEVRSRASSQRPLATREIILIHHTDCGMFTFTDDEFKAQIEADTGVRPGRAAESLRDSAADVKQSLARIAANPFIPREDQERGFVSSVTHGSLTEIT